MENANSRDFAVAEGDGDKFALVETGVGGGWRKQSA